MKKIKPIKKINTYKTALLNDNSLIHFMAYNKYGHEIWRMHDDNSIIMYDNKTDMFYTSYKDYELGIPLLGMAIISDNKSKDNK